MSKESRFKIHYHLQNNGDGSASVKLHPSLKEAEAQEEKDIEDGRDGWGESCAGSVHLKVLDGKIYYRDDYYDEDGEPGHRYVERWLPAEKD